MKAVFLDFGTMGGGIDLTELRSLFSELQVFDDTADEEIAERIADFEFVLTNKARLTAEIIDDAEKLRYIGLTATGTDNIDLDAASRNKVAVANIRAYCTESVVEHVLGSILLLSHSLNRYDASVKAGDWQQARDFCMLKFPIRQLTSMTLGIVGYGALGQGVAKAARAFGMRVIVTARPGATEIPGDRVAFNELLAQADVITLHCPLTDETRNLFDAKTIGQMKPGAMLVNTARGALIDADALVAALESGHLAGAAVDVLSEEPPVNGNPLVDYGGDTLLLSPHIAWGTDQARQNAIDELTANAEAFIAGESRCRVV